MKTKAGLPPADTNEEFALLLRAVRAGMDGTAPLASLPHQEVAWDRVLALAEAHRVVPLLYEGLKTVEAGLVPEWVMQRLRAYSRANATRCLWLVRELREILQSLEASGIPAMPFKGPALASVAYGNVAHRHAGDLDVLVREEDVARACDIVAARGYALPDQLVDETRPFLSDPRFLESADALREYQLICGDSMVEIHWQFTPRYFPFAIVSSDLWRRMVTGNLGGTAVRALPPEELLLMLCVHGGKHAWSRLNWVCDVAQVIRRWPDMDWPHVRQMAGSLGCQRMLLVGVLLSHQLFGTDVPVEVVGVLKKDAVALCLVGETRRHLARDRWAPPSEAEEQRFMFRARERGADRALYLAHLLVTPTHEDYEWLPLARPLSRLYHLLRPLRLLLRGDWIRPARPDAGPIPSES